jgi:hypothetical protein
MFLLTRKEELIKIALEERMGSSVSKSVSLLTIFGGMTLYATSPLAPVGLILGITGYVWAQILDSLNCHNLHFLPFIRGNALEVIGSMGHKTSRQEFFESYDEMDQLSQYLSPKERKELQLLIRHEVELMEYLKDAIEPSEKYLYVCNKFFTDGKIDFSSLPSQEDFDNSFLDNAISKLVEEEVTGNCVTSLIEAQDSIVHSAETLEKRVIAQKQYMIESADLSILPGCVLLAAPGAGKTTFLKDVWIGLKNTYKEKFSALFVVVKDSDLPVLSEFGKVISINSNFKQICTTIIDFIEQSFQDKNIVSRLFFDDYLTVQQLLNSCLKSCFIDIASHEVFDSKKEAKDSGAQELVPAYDYLMAKLGQMWLVGREFNSCLYVSSHSINVSDLFFIQSSTTRTVGHFIILARPQSREFINLALKNSYLISDKNRREELTSLFSSDLPEGIIVLSNFNNWELGVIPWH